MQDRLTPAGYDQTREKLSRLRQRLAEIDLRNDLGPLHKQEVRQSYLAMIRQLAGEIVRYETSRSSSRDDRSDGVDMNRP